MKKIDTEKQAAMREAEKERYLASLKAREEERVKSKLQSRQAEVVRSEKAVEDAQAYRSDIGSRTEFRDGLRDKRKADALQNQEVMDKLGQEYRSKLQAFNSRYVLKPQDLDKLHDSLNSNSPADTNKTIATTNVSASTKTSASTNTAAARLNDNSNDELTEVE